MKLKNLTLSKASIKWLYRFIQHQKLKWLLYTSIKSVSGIIGVSIALLTKQLIDAAVSGQFNDVIFYSMILGGALIFEIIIKTVRSFLNMSLSYNIMNKAQLELVERCIRMDWYEYSSFRTGDLLTRINSDISQIGTIWLSIIPSFIALIVQFIAAFFTLAYFDFTLALFIFLVSPLAMVASWYIGKYLKPINRELRESESTFRSYITDIFTHNMIVKVFQSEQDCVNEVSNLQQLRYRIAFRKVKFTVFSNIVVTIAYAISFFGVFLWGSYQIALGLLSFGTFTAYLQLISQIQSPVEGMAGNITSFISGTASIDRVMELEERNVEDSADKQPIVSTPPKLVINRLAFKYIKKSPWIFKDVDLDILPGEKVAFIGPSGQGKTTLIRILLSLIKPKSGHIQLDTGTDTFDINPETRNYYTYVPQGDTLFTGTIRTNLYLGNPNATDEELYHVLDLVCAKEFIQQMPDQLDTVLGEQGVGLSQGQAQRIAIARALLRGAAIILLDEATSALDIPTEEKILKNIFHAYKDFTIIVISHRDTIMSFVDKSYTLQDSDIIPHT